MTVRVTHDEWREMPATDFTYVVCELCGLVEFMVQPQPIDRADFAELIDGSGWSIERGVVTCPDCLDGQLHQGPTAES